MIRYPDRGLDVITLAYIDGRRGVLSARCQQDQTYKESLHTVSNGVHIDDTVAYPKKLTNQWLSLVEGLN